MFGEYLAVGLAFAIIELTIVNGCAPLKRWIMRSGIKEVVFSLALGAVLSFVLQIPPGVTIAIGGIFATIITKIIYTLDLFSKWDKTKVGVRKTKSHVVKTANEFAATIHIIYMVVSAPFRLVAAIMRGINRACAVVTRR